MNNAPPKELTRIHIIKLTVKPDDVGRHVDWLARVMMRSVETAGVLSAEIVPPASPDQNEWVLAQRFDSDEHLESWRNSADRKKLLDEIQPFLDSKQVSMVEDVGESFGSVGNIAVAVVTHVKPGQEAAYCLCEGKYQSAQAQFPGYRGAYVQPPTVGTAGTWTTIIRFDTPGTMDRWFSSDERKKLLDESNELVKSTDFKAVTTSFPGWFPSVDEGSKGPPNWKTAMLILMGLYPIVMLEIKFLSPLLHDLPSAAAVNFVGNILSVALTTWITMPLSIKAFSSWLFPTAATPKWTGTASILILLCIYAVEIALLWRLI